MKLLALLSSMPFESDKILACLKNVQKTGIAGKTAYRGKLYSRNVLLVNTGMGKVNASLTATAVIERFNIGGMINFGIGGAYPDSKLAIGEIAVATKEICDDGVITATGWAGIKETGIPLAQIGKTKYFNEFPVDKKLLRNALKALKDPCSTSEVEQGSCRIKSGAFLTVSAVSGTNKRAMELKKRFNAVCENMEGAAVAHVCAIYEIPMIEIRGISNIAGVRDKRKWDIGLASENCQEAILTITRSLR
ncbi:MAG TPA: futalosine hydrolase [Nitrospirae bacterium]|nr:futalosine hydrolase [Nitrospirota bacterium]